MVTNDLTLDEAVRVRGRFHRSVHLRTDWKDEARRQDYLVTPTVHALTERMLRELQDPKGTRAWSLTGPYGSGKSAFALFLSDVLTSAIPSKAEAHNLRDEAGLSPWPLVPVLVVGQRAPLRPLLLRALAESVAQIDSTLARAIRKASNIRSIRDDQVVGLFERCLRAIRQHGRHGGLLLIIDEFGKVLEHVGHNPDTEDLHLLQLLAESAARSEVPFVFLTILHTAFGEYLKSADEAQRTEWQKVQGRFLDIAFQEPAEQLLKLVGAAIEQTFPIEQQRLYDAIIRSAMISPALSEARNRLPLDELLPPCLPLEPITALLLWPLFRSKLAQNERSLFSFLTGAEPDGFQDFLNGSAWGGATPLYRIDKLYDYVTTALGVAAFLGENARRWGEIEHALARIAPDAHPLAPSVVKAVGLLSMYGRPVGVKPDDETLSLALGDAAGVQQALEELQRASIVIHRIHERAYGLWEGSDVDIDAWYEEARQRIGRLGIAHRLKETIDLRPVVARAHYIRTGTLRYFAVDVIDGEPDALAAALARDNASADGSIIYVLASDERARKTLRDEAQTLTAADTSPSQMRLIAFPQSILGIDDAAVEVEAWRWVRDNVPALQGDPVARREVRARLSHAQDRLHGLTGRIFGLLGYAFDPTASEWVYAGKLYQPPSMKAFLDRLSGLCARVYAEAPTLRNELLNRQTLSSSAAKARRLLLEAMLAAPNRERLDLVGYPAEVTMYETLLRNGGFHRKRDGVWRFGTPQSEWLPVWNRIEAFLATTHRGRRAVTDLYDELRRPPVGLREGPLPVILCAALLAHGENVALYEEGLFVPELRIEVLERLQRLPHQFEIQQYALTDEQQAAFAAVADALIASNLDDNATSGPTLLQVVKPLVLFVGTLLPYAKRTRRSLSGATLAVRESLQRARDPYTLLFVELPQALDLPPESERTDEFGERLQAAINELQHAYPQLLSDIEAQFRGAFGLTGNGEEIREEIQRRAAPLQGYAADGTLAGFIRESAHLDDRDWREVLGRVVIGGAPTTHWRDADVATFGLRLQQLASDFVRLEELVAERVRTGSNHILRIGVLNGRVTEMREVISVLHHQQPFVDEWGKRITDLLALAPSDGEDGRRLRLAALAAAVTRYLTPEMEESQDDQRD